MVMSSGLITTAAPRLPPEIALHRSRTSRAARRSTISASASSSSSDSNGQKHVLVPIANGTEEMEAVIIIDVLRRAGVDVIVASVEDSLQIKASRGVHLVADVLISEVSYDKVKLDMIVLPGGMPGAERLAQSTQLQSLLDHHVSESKDTAAICAAPAVVLQGMGVLNGRRATCHPGFASKLDNHTGARVEDDDFIITSQGPGTAMEFALRLVERLCGEAVMDSVAGPMVMMPGWAGRE